MSTNLNLTILKIVNSYGSKGCNLNNIVLKINKRESVNNIKKNLLRLTNSGDVIFTKNKYYSCKANAIAKCSISSVNSTFGFAKNIQNDEQIFISGRNLKGSMPGDVVLIKILNNKQGCSTEGMVLSVIKRSSSEFSGKVILDDGIYKIQTDTISNNAIKIDRTNKLKVQVNDKVICKIVRYGSRHFDHTAIICKNYGSSDSAHSCCKILLDLNKISEKFPIEVQDEVTHILNDADNPKYLKNRLDLSNELIFTIDSEHSKDLDDAVSLTKIGDYYELGVHIADVSHYIKHNSFTDKEAMNRGCSIYYVDKVVPMLPPELSNSLCSLNPNEKKLTFSVFMVIDKFGKLVDYSFKKTIIKSHVKGIYSEINQILNNSADKQILEKYRHTISTINLMNELCEILFIDRKNRGCPQIVTRESQIKLNKDNLVSDIAPRTRGNSENIIEEFMIMANKSVAHFAKSKMIPFVYRVHEIPSDEKLTNLSLILNSLGINTREVIRKKSPESLSKIIDTSQDKSYFNIVNKYILRSMSKAKYSDAPIGHYGLVLDDYSHFTSPIRRYPDLVIHRILSQFIFSNDISKIKKKYVRFVSQCAKASSNCELNAVKIERQCEDYYKAEYMLNYIGEEFEGVISHVTSNGIFIELENTIEGFIKITSLPANEYEFDGLVTLKNLKGKKDYRIGDKVNVKCISSQVSDCKIDFVLT